MFLHQVLNELLSFLPDSPVWNAGSLGVPGAKQVELANLENLGNLAKQVELGNLEVQLGDREGIVIASMGNRAREVAKLMMERKQASTNSWIVITSNPPDHSWTRAFQNGFIIEDKVN